MFKSPLASLTVTGRKHGFCEPHLCLKGVWDMSYGNHGTPVHYRKLGGLILGFMPFSTAVYGIWLCYMGHIEVLNG